jgi:Putative DNA-binding domain
MLEHDFDKALVDGAGLPHHRFVIYRNNIVGALVGALRVRFSVVEQLVGADFFRMMATEYCHGNKPESAVLIYYGATFSEYISGYQASAHLPYLADVARFEDLWWQAYHAADAATFDVRQLEVLSPNEWGALKFKFHPYVQIFKSELGAVSIWQWHQIKDNVGDLIVGTIEYALLSRLDFEINVRLISAEDFGFLQALFAGQCLADAVENTQASFPDFDLQSQLSGLFQLKLISGISS